MLYFAYGANLSARNMKRHAPHAVAQGVARLARHRLVFKGFADVVPDPKSHVDGVLFEITAACERSLDRYEDAPKLYRKATVTVDTAGGPKSAMIYLMNGGETAAPTPEYFNIIARGYQDWKFDAGILRRARYAILRT